VVGWLKQTSGLPVVVKGVLRADDAATLVDAGADAVYVSNHGGRQLDRALSTAAALSEVAAAVGDRVEVYVDGGLRSGTDVLVALAVGARAVFLGRPLLWGLAAGGERGVARVVDGLTDDLRHVLALAGTARLEDVAADLVVPF
jgi:4-hydroxymandelate oxidase